MVQYNIVITYSVWLQLLHVYGWNEKCGFGFKIFISITFYKEGRGHEYIYKPVLSTGIIYHNIINCLMNKLNWHQLHRYNSQNRENDATGNFQKCYKKVKEKKRKTTNPSIYRLTRR
jgi:trehalose utilization protein